MPMLSKLIVVLCALTAYAKDDNTVTFPPAGVTRNGYDAGQCKEGTGKQSDDFGKLLMQGQNKKYNCDCLTGLCKASSCEVAFDTSSAGANCPVGAGNDDNCRNTKCVPWGYPACQPKDAGNGGYSCFGTVDCVSGSSCPNKGKLCLLDGDANANTNKNYKICSPDVLPSPPPSWSPRRSPEPSPSPGNDPNGPTGDEECECDDKYRNGLCIKLETGKELEGADLAILQPNGPGSGPTSTVGYLSYTIPDCSTLAGKKSELERDYGCRPAAGCDTDYICEKEVPLDYINRVLSAECGVLEHRTIITGERD